MNEWLYVYGFVHPESGESQWVLLPSVNIEVFTMALKQFAQAAGASPHFSHLIHRNCSLASASGHFPTRQLLIAALRRWTSCKRRKQNAVSPFKTMQPVSATRHSST